MAMPATRPIGGGALAKRRRAEAEESGRRLGITYEVLDNHDGELLPTLDVREQIIRRIRQWNADIVLAPRPNDYHPDHRYTGVLVEDAAYMVVVPNICPDTPPLRNNPVFLYYEDHFQKPSPFRPDVAIDIDSVFDKKIDAAGCACFAGLRMAALGRSQTGRSAQRPGCAQTLAGPEPRLRSLPGRAPRAGEMVWAGAGRQDPARRSFRSLRVRPSAH